MKNQPYPFYDVPVVSNLKETVKTYAFSDFGNITDKMLCRIIKLLPDYRKSKVLKHCQTQQRKASVIAFLLLIYGLREIGITAMPEFSYGKNGKPYLKNHPDIFFSISHCNESCMCVISNIEIGCDIQEIRPYSQDIALRVCCEDELTVLAECDNKATLFTEMWTKKESYIKQQGLGISDDTIQINTMKISNCTTFAIDNCIASICC